MPRTFSVVMHDVTPVFADAIDRILEYLLPETGDALAGAVVPQWHGIVPSKSDGQRLRKWSALFGETLLHGWTHRRERRPGVVSRATNRADEFGGCPLPETVERIRRGRSMLEQLVSQPVRGFLPPAWQIPAEIDALRESGIEFLVRFGRLESASARPVALATFSWDWGRVPFLGRLGSRLGSCARLWNRGAVPVIAVHPADLSRGHVACALRAIRRLKRAGWMPCRIGDLAPVESEPTIACKTYSIG